MKINDSIYIVASGAAGFGITDEYDCTVFLVKSSGGYILIDAGAGLATGEIIGNIERWGFNIKDCKGIFITHAHADHIGGVKELAEKSGAKVYGGALSAEYITNGRWDKISLPRAIEAGLYPQSYKLKAHPVTALNGRSIINIDGLEIEAIPTPGHSSGHNCYYMQVDSKKVLFSGDSVFLGGKISLQDIWDCSISDYCQTVKTLAGLEVDALLPSHFGFVMSDGKKHIEAALKIVSQLGIPKNAGYFV